MIKSSVKTKGFSKNKLENFLLYLILHYHNRKPFYAKIQKEKDIYSKMMNSGLKLDLVSCQITSPSLLLTMPQLQ